MLGFVNRTRELAVLDRFYERPGFQFVPVYGRRRVGKTALLKRFCQDKRSLYFLCRQLPEQEQLRLLGQALGEALGDGFLAERGFGSWEQVFRFVARQAVAGDSKFVLVLDEYPYLLASRPGISSLFQAAIDEQWGELPMMLVLCGSQIGMMEQEMLGYKAPLYGRRTGQLNVTPFTFRQSLDLQPKRRWRQALETYAIVGGIPAYLRKVADSVSTEELIITHFGQEEEFLVQEPEFLLRQEVRQVRHYFSLVQAIARGHRKLGNIVNETGLDKATAGKYLRVLQDLHVVDREVPVLEPKPDRSRRGLYRLCDNLFEFWFRYIFPNRHLLGLEEEAAKLYQEKIADTLDLFVAQRAEEVARQLVKEEFSDLARVGRQWDRRQEVDIVGLDAAETPVLVGEVKWWRDKPVGVNVLEALEQSCWSLGLTPDSVEKVVYSASGFTPELKKRTDVHLRGFQVQP